MWAIFTFLAIISFVVAHEAGHYIAAKLTGMKVTEFFAGFGPRIWSFRRGETEYGFKWIMLGGYVKVVGMSVLEEVAPEDMGRTYREKEFWKKSVVVLSGVVMNFLIAFLIFFSLNLWRGQVVTTPVVDTVVDVLEDGRATPAKQAGLLPGDRILAVDDELTPEWPDISAALASRPDQEISLTVERGGNRLELSAQLATRTDTTGEELGFLGIGPSSERVPLGAFTALGQAGQQVGTAVRFTTVALGNMVRPQNLGRLAGGLVGEEVPSEIRPVSPIGLAQIGSQVNEFGVANLFALLASVNIILGTLNVLPLYPLDGGHFAVALWEKVTRRRVDMKKLAYMAWAVIGFVVFLSLVAIVSDILNPIEL